MKRQKYYHQSNIDAADLINRMERGGITDLKEALRLLEAALKALYSRDQQVRVMRGFISTALEVKTCRDS